MFLTGKQIQNEVERGLIELDPFDPSKVGPNSYDVCLGPSFKRLLANQVLDTRSFNSETAYVDVPVVDGRVRLFPGELYLGHTAEVVGSDYYLPWYEGRSSFARMGVSIHVTAGVGQVGFKGQVVLEIQVVAPTILYVGDRIAQVLFCEVVGERTLYKGSYQNQRGPRVAGNHL